MYKFSKRSLERLNQAHDDLKMVMLMAIKESPYDFGISSSYRSPEEQNKLYQQGRTTEGNIVTYVDGYNKKSKHNYNPSLAVDIMCYAGGKVTWEPAVYLETALHILEVAEDLFLGNMIGQRLNYGGYWKRLKDYPHFEL